MIQWSGATAAVSALDAAHPHDGADSLAQAALRTMDKLEEHELGPWEQDLRHEFTTWFRENAAKTAMQFAARLNVAKRRASLSTSREQKSSFDADIRRLKDNYRRGKL